MYVQEGWRSHLVGTTFVMRKSGMKLSMSVNVYDVVVLESGGPSLVGHVCSGMSQEEGLMSLVWDYYS